MKEFNINRRLFMKGAAASLVLSSIGTYGMDIIHPPKSYKVGLIGSGWYGKSDLFRLLQVTQAEVVALSDPDKNMLNRAGALVQERTRSKKPPVLYTDYRKMLATHPFDIVLIATPDHWHALSAIDAMKAGAHIYLQKPVSVDVIEGEALVSAAKKFKKVIQVGLQRRSTPHWMEAKKNIIEAGLLGKISHVDMCCYYHMRYNDAPLTQEIPEFFDYDLWTGPAPIRSYDGLPHGRWRSYSQYGNGIVGDMCVHMLDGARWLLNLGWPKKITSTGGIYVQKQSNANIPDTQNAVFEFDELNCVWQHRTWGTPADPEYPWALKIYGELGTLSLSTHQMDFAPVGEGKKVKKEAVYERNKYPEDLTEQRIELHAAPATRGQMVNFLHSIVDKHVRPVADIEEGHISTASCILANISMELNRPVMYDTTAREVAGDVQATQMLTRIYREGYVHPVPEST